MICPFCQIEVTKFHPNSHIIPEWMYKNSYDEIHRAISLDLDNLEKDLIQQGFRGSFICDECEKIFSKDDDYGSKLFANTYKNSPIKNNLITNTLNHHINGEENLITHWESFDFNKLQKFILSVLIRNHLWNRNIQKIHLNDAHYEAIKNLYLNKFSSDETSYPIKIIKLIETEIHLHPVVILPYISPVEENHKAYIFAGAGYIFYTYISSHKKPIYLKSFRLRSPGSIDMLHVEFEKTGIFKNSISSLQKINQGK
jgi:hypothetical protein